MNDLSEEEILKRLLAKRENFKVTHEEVIHPDYEMWGRAREWHYHQGVCLLASLAPVSKPYFDLLINEKSFLDLVNWYMYYPTEITDRNRLKNIDRFLEQISQTSTAKKHGGTISPNSLIAICKGHSNIVHFLPIDLIEVIDKLGPHPSLNLPSTFCSLEINPTIFENLKKIEQNKNKPQSLSLVKEDSPPQTLPTPPVPSESPLSIAKRLFPLNKPGRWQQADALSLNETILLHYGIDPEQIYETHQPGESVEKPLQEFLDYLNRFFFGDRQWFLSQLDENKVIDLLRRSIHAGFIKLSDQGTFLKAEIVEWMASKQLSFPLHANSSDSSENETSKEDLLNYDLKRLTGDQLAKLMSRVAAAAIWKQPDRRNLQQMRRLPQFKKALALAQEIAKKNDEFDEKTVEDWIRNLNPNYKPKK